MPNDDDLLNDPVSDLISDPDLPLLADDLGTHSLPVGDDALLLPDADIDDELEKEEKEQRLALGEDPDDDLLNLGADYYETADGNDSD